DDLAAVQPVVARTSGAELCRLVSRRAHTRLSYIAELGIRHQAGRPSFVKFNPRFLRGVRLTGGDSPSLVGSKQVAIYPKLIRRARIVGRVLRSKLARRIE